MDIKPVYVTTSPAPDFALEISLNRHADDVPERVASLIGAEPQDLRGAGMFGRIKAFLGDAGDSGALPSLPDRDELVICPVAYALSRHAGFDPVAMYALARVGMYVGIDHPWWTRPLHVVRSGHTLTMRAPVAPGAVWYGTAGPYGWLLLDPEHAGIPQDRALSSYARMMGHDVASFVSHPILDAMDLHFTKVTASAWNLISAHTGRAAPPVTLARATTRTMETA